MSFRPSLQPALRQSRATALGFRAFAPAPLFAAGEQGGVFAANDVASESQDSAGATPVTAVEQVVGKWLDRSGRGNHLLQAGVSTLRGVSSARVNQVIKSQEFDDAAWVKNQTTVTANATTAPDGTLTADKLAEDATINNHALTYAYTPVANVPYTLTVSIKAAERGYAFFGLNGGGIVQFGAINLATGAVTAASGAPTLGTPVAQANGFWRVSLTATPTSTLSMAVDVRTSADGVWANRSYQGVAGNGVYVWGADLRTADDAAKPIPPYQRVNTPSDYDTAGFFLYNKLDGVDDYYTCASGGGGTAGFLYCAAITVTGGAGTARTLWDGRSGNNGYEVRLHTDNSLMLLVGNGAGLTLAYTTDTTAVGGTYVLTVWDDGVNLNAQINNGSIVSVARPVVTAGTAGFTVGRANGGSSQYFNGRIYGYTRRASDCGATLRQKLKQFHGRQAGLSL